MFPRAGFLRVVHILGRSQRHVKSRLGSGRRSLMRDSSPRTVPTTVDRGIRYSESWAEFYQRYFQIGGDLLRELYSFSLVTYTFLSEKWLWVRKERAFIVEKFIIEDRLKDFDWKF